MHLKKISAAILAGIIILLPLTSCGKDDSDQTEETTGIVNDASETEETEAEKAPEVKGDQLGQMYAIEELATTSLNPIGAGGDSIYSADILLDPHPLIFRDDFLITPCYTGTAGTDIYMGLDIFEFATGDHRYVTIETDEEVKYIIPFECNDELYVCLQYSNMYGYSPTFYSIPFNDRDPKAIVTNAFDGYFSEGTEEEYPIRDVLDIYSYEDKTMMVIGMRQTIDSASDIRIVTNIEETDPEIIIFDDAVVHDSETTTIYEAMADYEHESVIYRGSFRADDGIVLTSYRSASHIGDNGVTDYKLRTFDPDRISFNAETGYYVNTLEGLYKVDGSGNEKKILDYNCVIGDPTLLYYGTFLKEKDGVFYFLTDTFPLEYEKSLSLTSSDSLQVNRHIFTVSPVDNPYAERTVLDMVSAVNDVDLLRNIYEFNKTSADYYIRLTLLDGSVPGSCVEENVSHALPFEYLDSVNSYSNYIYRLAQFEKIWKSYVNKNKPDLLYGMPIQEGMCNERYCMPLQDLVDHSSDDLMVSIMDMDMAQHDGNLYRIPLWFTFSCLTVDPSSSLDTDLIAGKDIITFEEYKEVLQDGISFFNSTRAAEGLTYLFNNEFDHYVDMKNREQHVDEFAFKNMVSYFLQWYENNLMFDIFDDTGADNLYQARMNSVPAFFQEIDGNLITYMSEKWCLPSNFETGYGAEITAAVAIGAGTDEANGAAQVVSFLMSDKQVTPSGELAFSINRKVTRSLNYSLDALLPYGEEDLIDQYYDSAIDTLNDIDHINTTDYVILDCILRYLSDLMEGKISLADYSQATATLVEKALNEK